MISVLSSIVIEGTGQFGFFLQILKRKKNTFPTFNKPKKEFSTLNDQLSTKNLS